MSEQENVREDIYVAEIYDMERRLSKTESAGMF